MPVFTGMTREFPLQERAGKADTRSPSVRAKFAGTWQLQSSVCIRSLMRQPSL
jgi:hypothetical protein